MRWEGQLPQAISFDLSDWTQIEITGPDRQTFLHNFCTNEVKSLVPGQGCEAFLPNIKGRILGHVLIAVADSFVRLFAVPGAAEVLVPHLRKYLLGMQADVQDRSQELGLLALCGDGLKPLLATRFGLDQTLAPHHWRTLDTASGTFLLGGSDITILPALLVSSERSILKNWRAQIPASELETGSEELFEVLRIEAGFPRHGIDLSDAHLAQEAGRTDQAIRFDKGCYLGQEPIARLDALGHTNKELRGLLIDSADVTPGSTIHTGAAEVGIITSAAFSPPLGKTVALGMVRSAQALPGTSLTVLTTDGPAPAEIYWPKLERERK